MQNKFLTGWYDKDSDVFKNVENNTHFDIVNHYKKNGREKPLTDAMSNYALGRTSTKIHDEIMKNFDEKKLVEEANDGYFSNGEDSFGEYRVGNTLVNGKHTVFKKYLDNDKEALFIGELSKNKNGKYDKMNLAKKEHTINNGYNYIFKERTKDL